MWVSTLIIKSNSCANFSTLIGAIPQSGTSPVISSLGSVFKIFTIVVKSAFFLIRVAFLFRSCDTDEIDIEWKYDNAKEASV